MANTPLPEFVTFEQAEAMLSAKVSKLMCALWALDIPWESKMAVTRMITEKSPEERLLYDIRAQKIAFSIQNN